MSDDRTFLDALNHQFEAFFGLDKLRTTLDPDSYLAVRAAIATRPIGTWRALSAAAVALALAQGGMAPDDIADHGLRITETLASEFGYSRHELIAEVVAEMAATYGLTGDRIGTVLQVVRSIASKLGGF